MRLDLFSHCERSRAPPPLQAFGLDAGFAGPSGNGSGGGGGGGADGGVEGWGSSRPRSSAPGDRGAPAPGSRPLPPPDDEALPSPPARAQRAGADSPRAVPPASQPAPRAQPPSGPKAPPAELFAEGDGKKFVGVSRRKQEQIAHGDDDVSRKNLKYEDKLTAGADGIMDIPELEEEGREDLSNVVGGVCTMS